MRSRTAHRHNKPRASRRVRWVSIGHHHLALGDARDVLTDLPPKSVDMIFSDPPYGHNNNNDDLIARREQALAISLDKPPPPRPIANDDHENATAIAELLFASAARLLRSGCCCCCGGGGGGPDPQFARWSLLLERHLRFVQMIVWDKGPIGMGWKYRRSYETILVSMKPGGKMKWYDNSHRVENIIRPGNHGIRKIIPKSSEHPTPKPEALSSFFIRLHSQPGDVILDPLMGGGSTGVSAVRLGRRFIGCEISPRWFRMAERRIRKATLEAAR